MNERTNEITLRFTDEQLAMIVLHSQMYEQDILTFARNSIIDSMMRDQHEHGEWDLFDWAGFHLPSPSSPITDVERRKACISYLKVHCGLDFSQVNQTMKYYIDMRERQYGLNYFVEHYNKAMGNPEGAEVLMAHYKQNSLLLGTLELS